LKFSDSDGATPEPISPNNGHEGTTQPRCLPDRHVGTRRDLSIISFHHAHLRPSTFFETQTSRLAVPLAP
jgi:hypothetical protein